MNQLMAKVSIVPKRAPADGLQHRSRMGFCPVEQKSPGCASLLRHANFNKRGRPSGSHCHTDPLMDRGSECMHFNLEKFRKSR